MIRDASQIAGVCQATNSGRRPTPAEGASQIVAVGQATNSRGRSVAAKHQLRQAINSGGRPTAATNQQGQATLESQLAVGGRLTANRSHGGATI